MGLGRVFSLLVLIALLPAGRMYAQAAAPTGAQLFQANCAACHALDKKINGPALRGYRARIPGGDWIYRFIKNPNELRKAKDPYTVKIVKEYNGQVMIPLPHLTQPQVDAILAYIDSQ